MADEDPKQTPPTEPPNPQMENSLEGGEQSAGAAAAVADSNKSAQGPKKSGIKAIFNRFSIYLLLFALVLVLAAIVIAVSYMRSQTKPTDQINSQTLSSGSLSQLSQSDVSVGDAKQTLNVQSNAVFAGGVLMRKDLQVAGKLQVGGSLSLTAITVSGAGDFGQVDISKNLQVGGDTALQGQLTVANNLSVNGTGTFNGALSAPQLNVNTLQMSGDLQLTHHIAAGGVNPGRTSGSNLGSGGTSSVSGSDTAGSISINTGSGAAAGCMITVTFTAKFNATPHVVVTPVEAAAAGLQYYVTRTTSNFSVCTANAPPSGQSFGFDYIVFD